MRVYEKVREYVDDNGFKRAVVAKQCGMPESVFNEILSGERTLYADELRSICIALNVRPELFVEHQSA